MNTLTGNTSVHTIATGNLKNIALWTIQAFVAAAFIMAGCSIFSVHPQMAVASARIAGSVEITSAVMVLTPRTAFVGAGLIILIVAVAALANWTLFHTAPAAPILLGVLSAVILWGRRCPENAND
jgi:hypothetical protein